MPSDDYAPVVRGGLKLKGTVKPSGITKKKKKKKSINTSIDYQPEGKKSADDGDGDGDTSLRSNKAKEKDVNEEEGLGDIEERRLSDLEDRGGDNKTASERAYEEARRKRLNDRLQREGVKTHKQRVEELNKYLSNLSEHHDMPRIGPG